MSGPHDHFVRYTFGHPERAAAELRATLPAHVVAAVDWDSLRLESGSVVDPELRKTESDLLFSARLRSCRPLLLYVLFEHQSSLDVFSCAWCGGRRRVSAYLTDTQRSSRHSGAPGTAHVAFSAGCSAGATPERVVLSLGQ